MAGAAPRPWTDAEESLARRMAGADILSVRQFTADELVTLLDLVARFEGAQRPVLQGKVLAALFFEPSTRTRLSFESAMARLGGACLGFADAGVSSTTKGESLSDTIRMAECYADVIVIRHPREGAARVAADSTGIPIINGGDGSNQHPTQTLLDLYTIRRRCGRLDGLRIGFLGDLKYGRAAHSLIEAVGMLGNQIVLVAPDALKLPAQRVDELRQHKVSFVETGDLDGALPGLDVLYVTRIQQERFGDPLEFQRVRDAYQVDAATLDRGKAGMIVMHPLPRVNEIHPSMDASPQAAYFEQARNGVTVRKAVLALLLGARP
ncbi:MAG: Aspartate carbamoyltransferase catalytic subunit [Planctomycetes bacterium]|nr:Aspartate carbamoyltransferase catalytic subunit [Planctomycetota bacterium]